MNPEEKEQESSTEQQENNVVTGIVKGAKKAANAISGFIGLMLAHPAITCIILVFIFIFVGAIQAMGLSLSDEEGFENIKQHTEEKAGRVNSGASSSGSTVAPGERGYEFFQQDYPDVPFGTSNISAGGCGITSMAMCVSDWLGNPIDPKQLASEFNINPYWIEGSGVSWSFFGACAEHYGLQCQELGTDPNAVVQALREGKKVISSQSSSGPFTQHGHIIYFYGLDSSGNIVVKDPNRANVDKGLTSHSWNPSEICSWSKNNFAIWK